MKMQPSQLAPLYPFFTAGLFGVAVGGLQQPMWDVWRAQVEPFPASARNIMYPSNEAPLNQRLAAYIEEMSGTPADLDVELERAAIQHLLESDETEQR